MYENQRMIKFLRDGFTCIIGGVLNHKKYATFYFIVMALLFIGIIIVFDNYNWYDMTIAKIVNVENTYDHEVEGYRGENEKYYNQELIGTIMNGALKGDKVELLNRFSASGVYDDEYQVGDEVFITLKSGFETPQTGIVTGLKRDKNMAI